MTYTPEQIAALVKRANNATGVDHSTHLVQLVWDLSRALKALAAERDTARQEGFRDAQQQAADLADATVQDAMRRANDMMYGEVTRAYARIAANAFAHLRDAIRGLQPGERSAALRDLERGEG